MTKTQFDSLTDRDKIFAELGLQILRELQLLRTEVESVK